MTKTSFHIKCTTQQHENFKEVAAAHGMNLSEYVRYLLSIEYGKLQAAKDKPVDLN